MHLSGIVSKAKRSNRTERQTKIRKTYKTQTDKTTERHTKNRDRGKTTKRHRKKRDRGKTRERQTRSGAVNEQVSVMRVRKCIKCRNNK